MVQRMIDPLRGWQLYLFRTQTIMPHKAAFRRFDSGFSYGLAAFLYSDYHIRLA